jgi:hypothetical protein
VIRRPSLTLVRPVTGQNLWRGLRFLLAPTRGRSIQPDCDGSGAADLHQSRRRGAAARPDGQRDGVTRLRRDRLFSSHRRVRKTLPLCQCRAREHRRLEWRIGHVNGPVAEREADGAG